MRRCLHIIVIVFIIMSCTAVNKARASEVHQRYGLVGETVHLSLRKQRQQEDQIKWKKGETVIAILDAGNQVPRLNSPANFNVSGANGSLIISNVQKNHSGHYKVVIGEWEMETTEYLLTVEGAVSKPVIKTDELQINSSTYLCRISVKCSAEGERVMYDCEFPTCTETNRSLTKLNITVNFTDDGLIECIASNHVSANKSLITTSSTCPERKSLVEHKPNLLLFLPIALCCGLVVILVVCVIIIGYCYSRKKLQNEDTLQEGGISTIYSEVCKPQTPTESKSASTVYDVPSKCVTAPQGASVQILKKTQERPPEDSTVTASSEREEESENDQQLTVYWKLGQK